MHPGPAATNFMRGPGCASLTRATGRGRTCLPMRESRRGRVRTTVQPTCSRLARQTHPRAKRQTIGPVRRSHPEPSPPNPLPLGEGRSPRFVARIRPKAASGDNDEAWFGGDLLRARPVARQTHPRATGCRFDPYAARTPTPHLQTPVPSGQAVGALCSPDKAEGRIREWRCGLIPSRPPSCETPGCASLTRDTGRQRLTPLPWVRCIACALLARACRLTLASLTGTGDRGAERGQGEMGAA